MKTISTIILVCSCIGILFSNPFEAKAQSLQIVGDVVQKYTSSCKKLAEYVVPVKNISSSPVKVRVRKETITSTPEQEVYFCWVSCYNSSVNDSPNPGSSEQTPELPAGKDTNLFHAYVEPRVYNNVTGDVEKYVEGVSEVRYHFFNEDDPSDEVSVVIRVEVSCVTDVNEEVMTSRSSITPNPAGENTVITFSEKIPFHSATIQLFDALGKHCGESMLQNGEQQAHISTSTMAPGAYSYTVVSDKGMIYTRGTFTVAR